MATIFLPLTEVSPTKKSVIEMLWRYLEMKYPYQSILHSTTDDKIFVCHGHQMKVIEWFVLHQVKFEIIDYESFDPESDIPF